MTLGAAKRRLHSWDPHGASTPRVHQRFDEPARPTVEQPQGIEYGVDRSGVRQPPRRATFGDESGTEVARARRGLARSFHDLPAHLVSAPLILAATPSVSRLPPSTFSTSRHSSSGPSACVRLAMLRISAGWMSSMVRPGTSRASGR